MELKRDTNETYIDLERNLGEFWLLLGLTAELVLLFGGLVCLCLGSHMLSFGANANGLKDKALYFEHMIRVILLYSNLILADIIKKLLKKRIVGVLYQVLQVLFDNGQKSCI